MNKHDFLQQLAVALAALSDKERDEILADYRAYFDDAQADGRSEDDVAAALGDPQRLARELTAERKLKQWEAHKTPGNMKQVLGALAGLGMLNLLLALPYLLVLTLLSSLWLTALAMLLAGVLLTGGWASQALFGWPSLNDSGVGAWLVMTAAGGKAPAIHITGEDGERVAIHTDAQSGHLVVEASDGEGQFRLEKAPDGRVVQLQASDAEGSIELGGLAPHSRTGLLVLGLVLLLLGALGGVLGWKALKALWQGTGSWLRWQQRLLNGERLRFGRDG